MNYKLVYIIIWLNGINWCLLVGFDLKICFFWFVLYFRSIELLLYVNWEILLKIIGFLDVVDSRFFYFL